MKKNFVDVFNANVVLYVAVVCLSLCCMLLHVCLIKN